MEPEPICDDQLIDLIEGNEILYNTKHPEYKNNMKKHDEWNRIASILGQPSSTCQNRWKLIKRSYNRDLVRCKSSGGAAGKKKKYTRDLSFLEPFVPHDNDNSKNYDEESSRNFEAEAEESDDAFSEFAYVAADSSFGAPSRSSTTEIKKSIADISKLIKNESAKDSSYYFCMSLVEPLRAMGPKKRQLTQLEIMKIIAQNTD